MRSGKYILLFSFSFILYFVVNCVAFIEMINVLYVKEVLSHFKSSLQYKMGHYFLHIQYVLCVQEVVTHFI